MSLILQEPAALYSIIALTVLIGVGGVMTVRALKNGA